jgi:hypothetical protein
MTHQDTISYFMIGALGVPVVFLWFRDRYNRSKLKSKLYHYSEEYGRYVIAELGKESRLDFKVKWERIELSSASPCRDYSIWSIHIKMPLRDSACMGDIEYRASRKLHRDEEIAENKKYDEAVKRMNEERQAEIEACKGESI